MLFVQEEVVELFVSWLSVLFILRISILSRVLWIFISFLPDYSINHGIIKD